MGEAAQAVVAVVVGGDLLLQPHGPELGDRPRGETVAARLLPRKGLLLDDHDIATRPAEPVPGRRARRAAADHEDVVAVRRGHGFSLPVRPRRPAIDAQPGGGEVLFGYPCLRGDLAQTRLGEGGLALRDLEEQLVLLRRLLQASELDPLVQHDERQLLVIEGGVGGHAADHGLVGGAVGVGELLPPDRPEANPHHVVEEVRPGLEHPGERRDAGAPSPAGAVAPGAGRRLVDEAALLHRGELARGRRFEGGLVHVGPQREGSQDRHRPERDLLATHRRGDLRSHGLGDRDGLRRGRHGGRRRGGRRRCRLHRLTGRQGHRSPGPPRRRWRPDAPSSA